MANFLKKIFWWEEHISKTIKITWWVSLKFFYILKQSDFWYIKSVSNYLCIWDKSYFLKQNPLGFHSIWYRWAKNRRDFIKRLDEKIYENRFKKVIYSNKIEKLLKDYLLSNKIPENKKKVEKEIQKVFYTSWDSMYWEDEWY